MASAKVNAKCVACKHAWTLLEREIEDARETGTATCPKCYSPAVVESASVHATPKRKETR